MHLPAVPYTVYRKNRKLVIVTVLLLFFLSLLPCVYRTYTWAGDAYGLTTLATMPEENASINPYSRNGFFMTRDLAFWLLENTEYPYSRCSRLSGTIGVCETSLVNWIGRSLDLPGVDSEKAYKLLDHFITRGEPLDELSNGLAPVHEAVLYNNPRYLDILLKAGADPGIRIDKPEKPYHGYTAVQFLLFIEAVVEDDYSKIRQVFEQYDM